MKKFFTALMILAGLGCTTEAVSQNTTFGKVLYRVNCGGIKEPTISTDTIDWATDNFTKPSKFIDTTVVGNKVSQILTGVSLDPSVPASTPPDIFKDDRSMGNWVAPGLEYKFPIPAGTKVEVRLYFTETFVNAPNQRIFDIVIEGDPVLKKYDIFSEVGINKGTMKKFIATSDGTLNIFLKRIKQLPTISGIEIMGEGQDIQVSGIFDSKKNTTTIKAFPNPFINEVKIDVGEINPQSIRLFDSFGREINIPQETLSSEILLQMTSLTKGVYYLQVMEGESIETIRLVKE